MFDTITRKEFISILRTGENEIIYANLNLLDAGCTKIMCLLYSGNFNVANGRRCNVILSYRETYDTFDMVFRYAIIAYVIK